MRAEPPAWWYGGTIPPAAWGLLPVSALYAKLVEARFRTTAPYVSALPVICVGNFTMGGAGKTPVALKLASLLREAGRRPGFLTRGYGGREHGPHRIDGVTDHAERVGDEPLLLARAATTVVSRDRPAGAKLLEKLSVDTIIMDDGFQNASLAKTFSLVVVDGGVGIGTGHVFPLGPLRASLRFQTSKADAILILGPNRAPIFEPIARALSGHRKRRPKIPIFEADMVPAAGSAFAGRRVLAFCGIGRPSKFYESLSDAGANVAATRSFPDHYPYSEADAASLLAEARRLRADVATTEKDHIRLSGKGEALGALCRTALAFQVTVQFRGEDELRLMQLIATAIAARNW